MLLEMENDHLFSRIIASFLTHEDDDATPKKAAKMLTLDDISTIKDNPDFLAGAQDLMMDYIEAELRGLKIPTIKGKQAWGVYELQGIETKKYDLSSEKMTVDPSGRYRVMSDSAVREGPSKDSPKIGQLKPGTIVKVLETKELGGTVRTC